MKPRGTSGQQPSAQGVTAASQIRQLHLAQPRMTRAEIADRIGCDRTYVSQVLNNEDGLAKLKPAASVRQMVGMDGATYRAIRDRAERYGVGFDDVAGTLLAAAVAAGGLERCFPKGGRAS